MIDYLKGKKTYIVATLAGLVVVANQLGYLSTENAETLLVMLGAAGTATLAAKINRVQKTVGALFICALLYPALSYAQPTVTLAWEFDKVPTEVATYQQSVLIDGTAVVATPTCVALGTTRTSCSVPAPQLATGTHTVSIAAARNGITATTVITGIGAAGAPSNPTNPKLNIVITINIGGS